MSLSNPQSSPPEEVELETKPTRIMHGLGSTPEYRAWYNMKSRCYTAKLPAYKNYGGRGIRVCDEWLHDFPQFLKDVGKRPSPKHSLDRINVNGNYEPSNCRWVTKDIQIRNTRVRPGHKTGHNGVGWDSKWGKWRARIHVDRKYIHLGYFNTMEEALACRKEGELKYWGEIYET